MGFVSGLELLRIQLIKARETRSVLSLARLWLGSYPFQFRLNRFLTSRLLSLLDLQALLLGFEPGGIVALVRNAVSSVEFEDPACSIVQKVAIVSDGDHCAWKFLQELLEPGDAFSVQMVGWFVKQKHVGVSE